MRGEVCCQITASVLSYADAKGVPAARILEGLEHDEAYLRDPSNWVTWDFYHRLQGAVVRAFGDPSVWRAIGAYSVTSRAFGFVDTLARLFAGPKTLYRTVPMYVQFFSRISFVRWLSLRSDRGVAEVTIRPGGYMVRTEADYIVGVFEAMPVYLGLPAAESRLEVLGEFGEPGLPAPKPEVVLRLHLAWRNRGALRERLRTWFERRRLAERALEHFEAQALQLERRNREVETLNLSLEEKVVHRTAQLERALRDLRKANEEKEEFLRAVSHDLCAPLRNISGMAESLERQWGEALGAKGLDRVGRIRRNAARMTGMIDDLLELSRIKTRRSRKTPTDLGALVREVGERIAFELEAKGIRLEIAPDLPTLCCEGSRIAQVFQNLIDNACKYMHAREDARIRVSARDLGDRWEFAVEDNGPGIAPEDRAGLFTAFRRGRAAAPVDGKGVGLATVKAVVENYGGEVRAESELGRGTAMIFTLAESELRPDAEASASAEGPARPGEGVPRSLEKAA